MEGRTARIEGLPLCRSSVRRRTWVLLVVRNEQLLNRLLRARDEGCTRVVTHTAVSNELKCMSRKDVLGRTLHSGDLRPPPVKITQIANSYTHMNKHEYARDESRSDA
eukprot:8959161-Pyramimonas_sp.AAC.1